MSGPGILNTEIKKKQDKLAELKARKAAREAEQKRVTTTSERPPSPRRQEPVDDVLSSVNVLLGYSSPDRKDEKKTRPDSPPRGSIQSLSSPMLPPAIKPSLTIDQRPIIEIMPVEVIKYDVGIQVDVLSAEDAERLQTREKELEKEMAKEREHLRKSEESYRSLLTQLEEEKKILGKKERG